MNKKVQKICFNNFLKQLRKISNNKELLTFKLQFIEHKDCLGIFKDDAKTLLKNKELQLTLDNKQSNVIIEEPTSFKPLSFNLKGLDSVKNKIDKIDNSKLKFEFKGLFNLLNDRTNLIYNDLYTRKRIIKDLNKFKSLKFFKVGHISRYDLKKDYQYLVFKNNTTVGHSKVYFIKKGLYVLKTLNKDDINLKVFYIGKKYKTLLKPSNDFKRSLKGDKYNISSVDAYKTLDKKDNIKYYSFCNSIGLDKKNRDLLRSIRKSKKISRDSFIESLEERKKEILEDIEISSSLEVLYLEMELQDIEEKLQELKTFEEDNSMEDKTSLSDYF